MKPQNEWTSADIAQHVRHRETPDQRARRLDGCAALAERVAKAHTLSKTRGVSYGPWAHPPRKRARLSLSVTGLAVIMIAFIIAAFVASRVLA